MFFIFLNYDILYSIGDIMKKRIMMMFLGLALVIIVLGLIFVIISKNNNYKNLNVSKFNGEYRTLKNNVDDFNDKRKTIYESVFEEIVIFDLKNNYSKFIENFVDYEELVIKLKENSSYLNQICFSSQVYLDEIINKCNTYKLIYKKSNNIFLDDLNNFNEKLVIKYNDINTESKLDLYKSKRIKKYID